MNKINSIFKLSTICLILSVSLFACKSSKKVADVSDDKDATEEVEQPNNTTVDMEMKPKSENDKKEVKVETISRKLENYFTAISNASGNATQANRNINEAKSMFASADVPVLIIINESADGTKDYDEPTTILDYMNYLKDQGKNLNEIYNLKTNDRGRITEVELIRK